jgi:hypothetical protein
MAINIVATCFSLIAKLSQFTMKPAIDKNDKHEYRKPKKVNK